MDKPKITRPTDAQRFPSVPLPKALERARELHRVAQMYAVPVATALKAWGYGEKSSGGLMTIAALKMFGLVTDIGSNQGRKVQLTESALKIIRDPRPDSPERDALLREAALTPPIHKNVHDKYSGPPPSEEAFRAYLLLDLGMRDDAADDFMREFNATMGFAGMPGSGTFQDMDRVSSQEPQDLKSRSASGTHLVPTPLAQIRRGSGAALNREEASVFLEGLNEIKTLFDGETLRVSACVDREGLKKLKKRLLAYEGLFAENGDDNSAQSDSPQSQDRN
jgi:hypothetical protein